MFLYFTFLGDTLDGMKNSPANGPGTPREEGPSMGDYGIPGYGQENVRHTYVLTIDFRIVKEKFLFKKVLKHFLIDFYVLNYYK